MLIRVTSVSCDENENNVQPSKALKLCHEIQKYYKCFCHLFVAFFSSEGLQKLKENATRRKGRGFGGGKISFFIL